jgi:omega-amidase
MRIAAVQMRIADGEPCANLRRARELLDGAGHAELFVLPELWTTGYAHDTWSRVARDETPEICEALRALAAERGAFLAGSMITLLPGGGLGNRMWVFAPDGAEPVFYDKGHLFAPMREPEHLTAGTRRVRSRVGDLVAAYSLCFDLRFPEMYRKDALEGAELFVVASEWPHPREEVLRTLARARAIENQAYLVLANRLGTAADGTSFRGGSMIVGPDGRILADAGETEGVVSAEADPGALRALRAQFPVLELRAGGLDW